MCLKSLYWIYLYIKQFIVTREITTLLRSLNGTFHRQATGTFLGLLVFPLDCSFIVGNIACGPRILASIFRFHRIRAVFSGDSSARWGRESREVNLVERVSKALSLDSCDF